MAPEHFFSAQRRRKILEKMWDKVIEGGVHYSLDRSLENERTQQMFSRVKISSGRKQDSALHNNNRLVETTKAFATHVSGARPSRPMDAHMTTMGSKCLKETRL